MALTRPRLGQLITNVSSLTDNLTVINSAASQANVDVGFIFNRTDGIGSVPNVAVYWNETTKSFSFATTADSGDVAFSNVNATSWANITAGNITANGFFWPNGASYGASIIAAQSIYSNANVASYLAAASINIATTGNISAGNVIVGTGLYFSNGTPFSTGTASVAGLNGQLQYNNNGVLAGANISFFSSNTTLVSTANITTTGNIVAGGVRSTTSATPPANPVPGDVWYNSTTDAIYRYTQDSTSSYWLNVFAPSVTSNSSVITTTTNANANVASYVTVAGGGFPGGVYYIPYGNIGNYTGNTRLGSSTNFFYNSSSSILAAPTGAFNQINAQVDPFTLVPTTINQMNFGNATTTMFVGASTGKVQMAGNLTVVGNITQGGYQVINSNNSVVALQITGAAIKGGAGYHDFLLATNLGSGVTNPSKWFRLNSTGGLEIVNSAYTTNIFSLDDTGNVTVSGNLTVNGTSGVVTPNRPAFRVIGNGGTISATTTLTSSNWTLDFQQGSALNTTTGIFTAPIAGLYQVNLVMRANSNSSSTISQAIVIKNVSTALCMLEFAANTTMNHAGVSTVAKLAVGDTIKLVVTVGTLSFDGNDNWSVAYIG